MFRDMGHLQTEKTLICMVPMVIPIPEVKPKVTKPEYTQSGDQSVPDPSESKSPRQQGRNQQSCQSKLLRHGKRITTNAAVGPETLKRDPPVEQ